MRRVLLEDLCDCDKKEAKAKKVKTYSYECNGQPTIGHSYNVISETFGIRKSTVGDIKKNNSKMKFVSTTESG
ncbi:hypothetical protein J437_LFUL013291 [Ladona fulva]|uniref:Uncharacterized protein n=1 Tax=Ladona fulva TaxID=123851 RepID=A0A8K0KG65_LADFU|nr:hypothetical protein J437_LFUL013291 [Ladona fulva]